MLLPMCSDGPADLPPDASSTATAGDLLTCGLCGQEFPLPNLTAFIGHKSLGTCQPREAGQQRRLASPSVTASDQVEQVESSGGGGEEEEEGEGERRTEDQADAATNTAQTSGTVKMNKIFKTGFRFS